MSGNGSAFSEYTTGAVLSKVTPTATNAGPTQMGMMSKSVGGSQKKRRTGSSKKGCSKKGGSSKRRSKKNRKSRSNRR